MVGSVADGMVHAPSVLAPLAKHDRFREPGHQTVVTVHDVVPWTHPETLTPRGVHFHRAMVKRAWKHADAVVVPTHAVADALNRIHRFDDRLRVIGGAPSGGSACRSTPISVLSGSGCRSATSSRSARARTAQGSGPPHRGDGAPGRPAGRPLVIAGPDGWGDVDVYGNR